MMETLFNYKQLSFIHRYAIRDISRSYKKLWVISTTLFISLLLLSLTFSIKQSMNEEIQANSKELLGGDIQISSGIEPLSEKTLEQLSQLGQISEMIELGTMVAKQGETPVFTQLRAVDSEYPLYGVMQTTPKDAAQQLFLSEAIPIVLINENIQNQLQLDIGDDVTIMGQNFAVGGLISSVPDIAQSAVFGEFAIINKQQFDKFKLKTGGSFLDHDYRLKITPDKTSEGIINQIDILFAQ